MEERQFLSLGSFVSVVPSWT